MFYNYHIIVHNDSIKYINTIHNNIVYYIKMACKMYTQLHILINSTWFYQNQ